MGAAIAAGVIGAAGSVAGGAMAANGARTGTRRQIRQAAQGGIQGLYRAIPWQLQFNQQYDPWFSALGSENLDRLLLGAEADTFTAPRYDTRGRLLEGTQTFNRPAQRGLVDILGETAGALRTTGIRDNFSALESNLGRAQDFYRGQNPDLFALREGLTRTANQNLAMGGRIAPEDAYRITSGVRSNWANRGLGASAPAQMDEALQLFAGGEQLRQSRANQSTDILSRLAATEPDYARFILGLGNDSSIANAFNLVGGNQAMAFNQEYDPFAAASGFANTGATLAAQSNQAGAGALAGLGGGMLDLAGSLISSGGLGG